MYKKCIKKLKTKINILIKLKDYFNAIKIIRIIILLEPLKPTNFFDLGLIYCLSKKHDKAIKCYQVGLKLCDYKVIKKITSITLINKIKLIIKIYYFIIVQLIINNTTKR